jgi:hypothetical protein
MRLSSGTDAITRNAKDNSISIADMDMDCDRDVSAFSYRRLLAVSVEVTCEEPGRVITTTRMLGIGLYAWRFGFSVLGSGNSMIENANTPSCCSKFRVLSAVIFTFQDTS